MNQHNPWIYFWPAWILVNTLGWLTFSVVWFLPFIGVFAAVSIGFLISVSQWTVLNHYIEIDSQWLWASILPYSLLLFVIVLFGSHLTMYILFTAEAMILGVLGFLQWSVLRNYLKAALIWVVASPLAALVGTTIAWVVDWILVRLGGGSQVLFYTTLGFGYGCITGLTLIFLETGVESRWDF
jgi:hypothetical protein